MKLVNKLPGLLVAAVSIAALVIAEAAFAAGAIFADAKRVEFESAAFTYQPSPFKLKQAKKLGKPVEIKTESSIPLFGYLARPAVSGPRPAVVVLHTCFGLSEHDKMWSDRLVDWGYVVFSVDSLSPRGQQYVCDGRIGSVTPWERALDAYGAKRYLSDLPFVDPSRIAVMGMSHGGMAVLKIVNRSTSEGLDMGPFRGAIAFYPYCGEPEPANIPLLILSGSEDRWTPAEFCQQYVDKSPAQNEVSIKVFDGAHHVFDMPGLDAVDAGYIVRGHPEAAVEASEMVREFLHQRLQ